MNLSSKADQVLEALCSLTDSLLAPIIDDLAACVAQSEAAARQRSTSEGLSPREAMAAEDLKVQVHEVRGKAKQYVNACKDVATYVCDSGVLAEVEKDLSDRRTEELNSFLTDVGEYLGKCLSRLRQYVAAESNFRASAFSGGVTKASKKPATLQETRWPHGCCAEVETCCRAGVLVGTTVSLVLLARWKGWETWYAVGSFLVAALFSSLVRRPASLYDCTAYCRLGTVAGTVSLVLLTRQLGWGNPSAIGFLFLASLASSLLHPREARSCRLYGRFGTLLGVGSLALLVTRAGLASFGSVGLLCLASTIALAAGDRWLATATTETKTDRVEKELSLAPVAEGETLSTALERARRNAELAHGLEAAKTCVDRWVKRTASDEEIDYDKVRASLRKLQQCMEKVLTEAKAYLQQK